MSTVYIKIKTEKLTAEVFVRYLNRIERNLKRSLVRTDWIKSVALRQTIRGLQRLMADKERIAAEGKFTEQDVKCYYD